MQIGYRCIHSGFLKVLLIFWNRQQYIPQDSFHKLVVTGDNQPFYKDYDGISYVGIIPFLLDKSILSRLMNGKGFTKSVSKQGGNLPCFETEKDICHGYQISDTGLIFVLFKSL